jgi:hypothetical protein
LPIHFFLGYFYNEIAEVKGGGCQPGHDWEDWFEAERTVFK